MTPGMEARTRLSQAGCYPGKAVEIAGKHCDCWIGPDEAKFVYTTDGVIYIYDEETGMTTMADLVSRYNAKVPAAERVKRFSTKKIAEKRVAEVEGAKRGRKAADGPLKFKTAPEDKVWQAESSRAKIFKQFEGKETTVQKVIDWAAGEKIEEATARGCINILVKDEWVTRA